jgi:hypothetical protein
MAIIQVWSAPSCQAGAECVGVLAPWVSASGSEATGTPAGFRVTVTRDVADRSGIAEGRCLRVVSQSRGEQWWFVSQVADSDGDAAQVQVTAGPLAQLLTVRGLVRSGSTFAFTTGKRTVTDLLNTYVLTNLSDDGLSWLSLGTVDATDTIEIGDLSRTTRAAVLNAIESQTGHTARLRGLYTSNVLTGFALDVVSDLAAGLDTVPLSVGSQIATLQRTRDALRAATVVVPFSAGGDPMEQTAWTVDSTSGSAPAWIVLRDPVSGNPWPVREDDQFIGAYILQTDGTTTAIADARASDSAVQVGAIGTLAAGQTVSIVRDTAGRPVLDITSPSGIAGPRGRLVATAGTRVTDGRRNLVAGPQFSAWASALSATGWAAGGDTTSITPTAGQFTRSFTDAFTGTTNAAYTGGVTYTSIAYTGLTPGRMLLSREILTVAADTAQPFPVTIADSVGIHIVDGTGAGTVTVNSWLAAISYSAGRTITLNSSRKPAAWPSDGVTSLYAAAINRAGSGSALTSSLRRMQSTPVTVLYDTERPYLRAAAGLTWRNRTGGSTTVPGGGIGILDTNTGAYGTLVASQAPSVSIPGAATAHETLATSVLMTATEPYTLALYSADESEFTTFARWASLWLDTDTTSDPMGVLSGSGSNALWHRAQDVLASAAQGTRYVVRGVDLTRLQTENGALALGQSVRLWSELLGVLVTVKIVKLDYDFSATETLNLELGAITPRLTGVTVTL